MSSISDMAQSIAGAKHSNIKEEIRSEMKVNVMKNLETRTVEIIHKYHHSWTSYMLYSSTLTWEEKEQEHIEPESSSLCLIFIFFPLNKLQTSKYVDDDRYFVCPRRQTGTGRVWEMSIVPEHMAIFQTRWEVLQNFVIVSVIVVMERVLI